MPSKISYALTLKMKEASPADLELLQLFLLDQGIPIESCVFSEKDQVHKAQIFLSTERKCLDLKDQLKHSSLKGCLFSIKCFDQSEWQDAWKKGLKPFWLTEDVRIFPYGLDVIPAKQHEQALILETGLAFGSGLHATTRLMAQLIEMKRGHYESFLDIGIGTGVLSLTAQHYGAKKILGIDANPEAVSMTQRNVALNQSPTIQVKHVSIENFKTQRTFDFVAANLLTEVLLRNRDALCDLVSPHQYLAVSGIAKENLSELKEHFAQSPLNCLRILEDEGWAALLYRKDA